MARDPDIHVSNSLTIPAEELVWRYSPSGGPGGQHANKSNTRVELIFEIAESAVLSDGQRIILAGSFGPRLRVVVDESRSQMRNRQVASERLASKLADASSPKGFGAQPSLAEGRKSGDFWPSESRASARPAVG